MSKKDYIKIADLLVELGSKSKFELTPNQHQLIINEFVYMLKNDNSAFDPAKFRMYIDSKCY